MFATAPGCRLCLLLILIDLDFFAGLEQMFLETGQPLPSGSQAAAPPSSDETVRLLEAVPHYAVVIRSPEH